MEERPGPGVVAGAPREAPPRSLRRVREGRVAFGVAGGLGRYLGVDPVVVRVVFVLLAVFGGSGVVLYLVGALAIPEERAGDALDAAQTARSGSDVALGLGAVLVLLGSLTLLGRFLPAMGDLVGPVLLVAAGVLVIVLGGRR